MTANLCSSHVATKQLHASNCNQHPWDVYICIQDDMQHDVQQLQRARRVHRSRKHTMQFAIFPCDRVQLLPYKPLALQTHVQASHRSCQLVFHYLHTQHRLSSAECSGTKLQQQQSLKGDTLCSCLMLYHNTELYCLKCPRQTGTTSKRIP